MTSHGTDGPQGSAAALVSAQHLVERCAGEFRRGVPVLLRCADGLLTIAASAETLREDVLAQLAATCGAGLLVITHTRATTLKIPLYTPDVICLPVDSSGRAEHLRAIADPASDLAYPMKGPFRPLREAPPPAAAAAVKLAKLAGLLPAAVLFPASGPDAGTRFHDLAAVDADAVLAFESAASRALQLVARARVPLRDAESCELAAFRPRDGGPEHYAILLGDKGGPALAPPGPVLVRLHSECFTGDLLGSLKCDCGDQLRGAIKAIVQAGGGILLYLPQEGRGIGMMNKMRAYSLQDEGFDTIEANERLGFEPDERLYDSAACMLTLLGYRSVRLMTNNPLKIRALEAAGVQVVDRVAHSFPDNAHNREYLRVKAERGGHLL